MISINSFNYSAYRIGSTTYSESEVKSKEEHGCHIPFFGQYFNSVPKTSQDLIEARRIKVKTHINQLDFLFTQLYFLAHQHNNESDLNEDCSPPDLPINASNLDENVTSIITCLTQYMKTLPEEKQIHLSKLLVPLQASVPIAVLICSLTDATTEEMYSAIIEQLVVLLDQQYKHLPIGSKMLIPAGYLTGNRYDLNRSGHAVLLELYKLEGGKVSLRTYNTGEGLTYHEEKNSMFFPFTIENVEESRVDRDFFKNLCLLGRQVDPGKPNGIADLYDLLTWTFGFSGNYYNPADYQYFSQGGANSCAHQCFMAWIKSSLSGEHADLFCEFINHMVNDRMLKIKEISGKEKIDLYIQKPYVVYSFTVQNSWQLTLSGAFKRTFQGPSVKIKIENSSVDKITTYFETHFASNTAFQIKPTYKGKGENKASENFKNVYQGKMPFSFQEMQKLRNCGFLREFLVHPELSACLKGQILSLNSEDVRRLHGLLYWKPLKCRLEKGAISLLDALDWLKSISNNLAFLTLPTDIQQIVAAGCLSIDEALALKEQQKKNLDNPLISQLIIEEKLPLQNALLLNEEEIKSLNLMHIRYRVSGGDITWQEALSLNAHQIEILEHYNIKKLIDSKNISVAEIFQLTADQLKWFNNNRVVECILFANLDWRKVIQVDSSELEHFHLIAFDVFFKPTLFNEFLDKTHPNYHVYEQN